MFRRLLSFIGIAMLAHAMLIQVVYAKNTIQYCKANQIKIDELIDGIFDGGRGVTSLYGVINTSKTPCMLDREIHAWAVRRDGKVARIPVGTGWPASNLHFLPNDRGLLAAAHSASTRADFNKIRPQWITLEPMANKDFIDSEKLAWFSFAAIPQGFTGVDGISSGFDGVKVRLSGLNKIFSIDSAGRGGEIAFFPQNNLIQKGKVIENWLPYIGADSCSYDSNGTDRWNSENIRSFKIFLRKVATCGYY